MDVRDKVALVTGGASGLGEATARAICGAGGRVVLVDRAAGPGQKLSEELGDSAVFAEADVTDPGQMTAAVDLARDSFGALDIAVGCAGIGTAAKTLGREGPMPLEMFSLTVNVNLVGMFNMIRLAANLMKDNNPNDNGERGVIITTASIAAFDGQIGQAGYSASKAGVAGMTLPIAREMARHGIRVMTIAPGLFDTPMLSMLPAEARTALEGTVPFPHRLGKPPEFASLALSIIGNSMLNGETIRLDGSLRMAPK